MKTKNDEAPVQGCFGSWLTDSQDFRKAVEARRARWAKQNRQPLPVMEIPVQGNHAPGDAEALAAWKRGTEQWVDALRTRLDAYTPEDLFAAVMVALCTWAGQRDGWGRGFFRLLGSEFGDGWSGVNPDADAGAAGFGSVFVSMEDGVPYIRFWNPLTKCSITFPLVSRPKNRPLRKQPNRPRKYRRPAFLARGMVQADPSQMDLDSLSSGGDGAPSLEENASNDDREGGEE